MKSFLKFILAAASVFSGLALIYRKWLEVSHTIIPSSPKKNIRIAHISDLHDYSYGKNNSKLIKRIRENRPDYICISGDLINSYGDCTYNAILFLRTLLKIAPVIYVQGNHELILAYRDPDLYASYIKKVKECGVILLDDEYYDAGELRFFGYTNPIYQYKKLKKTYALKADELPASLSGTDNDNHLSKSSETCYNILLAHNPLYFDIYEQWGADLTLSGHLHGGMIRLPFIGGIISPQTVFGRRYSGGLYEKDGSYMYVSRGLGLHTIHIRLFNRPELAILDL